jgi:hypothetical protein
MKWRKGGKKGTKKGGKRESQKGVSQPPFFVPFFCALFFFFISPELYVRPHFFWCSTLSVLLIEKRGKNWAENKENGKKGGKGWEKDSNTNAWAKMS